MAGKATPATRLLRSGGIPHQIHVYEHNPHETSYGAEAVRALGVAQERVFKTLVATVDDQLIVGIIPVAAQLDLKALAAAAGGKKATMADVGLVQRTTGYVTGGVSPLGQKRPLPTFVDVSAQNHNTVYCSGGRRGLEIELAPFDLVRLTSATFAQIASGG